MSKPFTLPFAKQSKRLALCLIGVVIVAICVGRIVRPPEHARTNSVETTLRRWLTYDYEPIYETNLTELVERIPLEAASHTDSSITQKVRECAVTFLSAFSSGSYSNYLRFRFPQEPILIGSNFLAYKKAVSATNLQPSVLSPPPGWAIDKHYLETLTNKWPPLFKAQPKFPASELCESNFTEVMVRFNSEGTFYKHYFESLCC